MAKSSVRRYLRTSLKRCTLPADAAAMFGHGKLRVLDELFGREQMRRLRDGDGRRWRCWPNNWRSASAIPAGLFRQRLTPGFAIEQPADQVTARARDCSFPARWCQWHRRDSGWQRRQGRNPASRRPRRFGQAGCSPASGVRAGQIGRQYPRARNVQRNVYRARDRGRARRQTSCGGISHVQYRLPARCLAIFGREWRVLRRRP